MWSDWEKKLEVPVTKRIRLKLSFGCHEELLACVGEFLGSEESWSQASMQMKQKWFDMAPSFAYVP